MIGIAIRYILYFQQIFFINLQSITNYYKDRNYQLKFITQSRITSKILEQLDWINSPFVISVSNIMIQSQMIQKDNIPASLQQLTLQQILQLPNLTLQKMFLIKDIHTKIQLQPKIFIDYCTKRQLFIDKLISLGIKSPIHQSSSAQMKTITFVSSDFLTCDHESLADLFILKLKNKASPTEQIETKDQIPEEIQIEEIEQVQITYTNKYTFLLNIFDYINKEILNQNCLNYLSKALQTLVRTKPCQFLQFFEEYPKILSRLIQICHFPCISHLLDRLITDDQDKLSSIALQQKSKIIPLLLQKLHNEIHDVRTYDILESVEAILQSSRYGQVEQRTLVQKLSDKLVSQQQIVFHVNIIKNSLQSTHKSSELLYSLNNSITYLTIVVTRMHLDEQKDYNNQQQQYKPKLIYQLDQLFLAFNYLLNLYHHIRQFQHVQSFLVKSIPLKFMEMCLRMSKHSQFKLFYQQIDIQQRIFSIKLLIDLFTKKVVKGVLLYVVSCILQNILKAQQKTAQNKNNQECITPSHLFLIVKQKEIDIHQIVRTLSKQSIKQRNKHQRGIYQRKFLIIIDNYLRNQKLQQKQSPKLNLSQISQQFNTQNCKKYAQIATLSHHLSGSKIKQVQQFKFIFRNINVINQQIPIQPQAQTITRGRVVLKLMEKGKNINEKAQDRKIDLEQSTVSDHKPDRIAPVIPNQPKSVNPKTSPKLSKGAEQGFQFFIRHLNIF